MLSPFCWQAVSNLLWPGIVRLRFRRQRQLLLLANHVRTMVGQQQARSVGGSLLIEPVIPNSQRVTVLAHGTMRVFASGRSSSSRSSWSAVTARLTSKSV